MRLSVLSAAIGCLALLSCGGRHEKTTPEIVARGVATLPGDPEDRIWEKAPVHVATLLLQDMVEPRLLEASTTHVRIQALADGSRLAIRMSWDDSTRSDLLAPGKFGDACAVQFPVEGGADLPAPQMGEEGRPVEIAFWSAAWQALVDGRPRDIHAIYPGAKVDHYPYEAGSLEPGSSEQTAMESRYAPARAVGNPVAGPHDRPVQDLLAAGPGTLTPAERTLSDGKGRFASASWVVLVSRPLPATLAHTGRAQAAFAVWEGGNREAGARKMRTGWIPISLEEGR